MSYLLQVAYFGRLTRGSVDSKDICVVARGKDQLRKLKKSLQKTAVSCYELDANGDDGDDRKQSGMMYRHRLLMSELYET